MISRAIMHDPVIFPEPERFYPERWLSPDAPTYPTTVFGFGARQCPGRLLTHANMWLMIVGILAVFDITPTEDGPPEETYFRHIEPFRCYIRPRSEAAASLVQMTENEA